MEARTLDLESLVLEKGNHPLARGVAPQAFCVMEAVAYVAGEPHTDTPECACPVISAFLRRWNDDLDDSSRQILKPLIPKLVGSRSTAAVEDARAWLLADWMIRTYTPAWLELAGLGSQAAALRALPSVGSSSAAAAASPVLNAARGAAGETANAAWDAAWAAAWDAAWDAARDAAWDAARAAAWDAAWDAA
ncbi:MAG TPA: hypothetical protein VJ735_05920, partial [Actinomycetes bacterium]|nr:hypothetical protein [Actinomycetes bacterium]